MTISHFYSHLAVNNGNFILLSDIYWSTMAILCCNLQVFLAGIGDTFVTLKANAHEIITLQCI